MAKKSFPPPRYGAPIKPNQDFPKPQPKAPSIQDTLDERGARYGDFEYHAEIAMSLKSCMRGIAYNGPATAIKIPRGPKWDNLTADQQQALDTICDKIARILNGDPNYDDNWRDISGYATLVLNRILKEQSK